MTLEEIKAALAAGRKVFWSNSNYGEEKEFFILPEALEDF